ncbi:GntR family transcriptional regulator [Virgibacillus oceani]|uniref:GntR family transcriptional regulator n=1 Tax=Virgibacillus oceani TaxID=1479511 RepID=A0A917HPD6_9BACI|nr:GntR family transcriptional regulator [Virgibacillus oceani]GGG84781.1 GntR family transcriptional regulator [Virgibacillus oceani]
MSSGDRNVRVVTKDFVYEQIKQKIITGSLQPNENVVEESLAKELDVSRTPLRGALQQLEHEELLVRKQNGRLKVAPISATEAKEIFMIRSRLEGLVARDAAERATKKDITYLKHITKMIEDAEVQGIQEDQVYFGMKFHTYLYEISGNKTATKLLNLLNDHINRYRRLGLINRAEQLDKNKDDHALILDYIEKGDLEKAELFAQDHVNSSMEAAIERIKNSQFVKQN